MPFRKPRDPEALERWRAVQRALKAERKAAAKADPKLLALKKAAKERQQAAYQEARKRHRAVLAEAKKRQKEAVRKAKELAVSQRATALLRKYVRPATTAASGVASPAPAMPRQSSQREPTSTTKAARTAGKAQPTQLAFANLTGKGQ